MTQIEGFYFVVKKEDWKSLEEFIVFLKHQMAYQFAIKYCKGKYVLDYGCGSGYGPEILSRHANQVKGVDINEKVIDYCKKTYQIPNLSFQIIDSSRLPFEDRLFDVIVSFQVIEHVTNVKQYLHELKRVLRDDGILIISTPNKKWRLLPFQRPWNPNHLREYGLKGFNNELKPVFSKVEILGLYGNKEINKIERSRVKQNPLKVYIYYPGIKVMRSILPRSVIATLKKLKRQMHQQRENFKGSDTPLLNKYSINDFTIRKDIHNCLDFIAICQK